MRRAVEISGVRMGKDPRPIALPQCDCGTFYPPSEDRCRCWPCTQRWEARMRRIAGERKGADS
jgi:hypothetical protein